MQGLSCPSCTAPVVSRPESSPASCARCGAKFHFDDYGTYVPLVAPCKVTVEEATENVMEWASGVKGGREFSRHIELAKMTRRYFPVFVFGTLRDGRQGTVVASATASPEPGIRNIDFSRAEMHALDEATLGDGEVMHPNLGPGAYTKLLSVDPTTRTMVYYPFWCTQYVYKGKLNTVTVDGCSGRVSGDLSVEIERRSSMPFAAAAFAVISAEGALAFINWIFAAAVVAATAGYAIYHAGRHRGD